MEQEKQGWQFWCNDNGRIRQFMVGHEDEQTARLACAVFVVGLTVAGVL
jgi:hypothetical protein